MKHSLTIILYLSIVLSGCAGLFPQQSYFTLLEPGDNRLTKLQQVYGEGRFVEFYTTRTLLRDFDGASRLEKVEAQIDSEIPKTMVCVGSYDLLDDTLGFFEGGGVNIFLKCH